MFVTTATRLVILLVNVLKEVKEEEVVDVLIIGNVTTVVRLAIFLLIAQMVAVGDEVEVEEIEEVMTDHATTVARLAISLVIALMTEREALVDVAAAAALASSVEKVAIGQGTAQTGIKSTAEECLR